MEEDEEAEHSAATSSAPNESGSCAAAAPAPAPGKCDREEGGPGGGAEAGAKVDASTTWPSKLSRQNPARSCSAAARSLLLGEYSAALSAACKAGISPPGPAPAPGAACEEAAAPKPAAAMLLPKELLPPLVPGLGLEVTVAAPMAS